MKSCCHSDNHGISHILGTSLRGHPLQLGLGLWRGKAEHGPWSDSPCCIRPCICQPIIVAGATQRHSTGLKHDSILFELFSQFGFYNCYQQIWQLWFVFNWRHGSNSLISGWHWSYLLFLEEISETEEKYKYQVNVFQRYVRSNVALICLHHDIIIQGRWS